MTRSHVELIEIPQRMGATRKNAADIKMAVDAIETAYERSYVTTFVICTGDSDFTPLVHKLRELNKKVIGVGVKASTSKLLPPACDEFLFYENLEGVEPARATEGTTEDDSDNGEAELETLVSSTLRGLSHTSGDEVVASSLKRAILRKDSTFTEADYGFRAFGEVLRHLEDKGLVQLVDGPSKGDPLVSFAAGGAAEAEAFRLLGEVVGQLEGKGRTVALSGLKNQLRKQQSGFSEKKFGFGGFLQFCKAAATRGIIDLTWDDELGDYKVSTP